jgi:hypothetical protein
MTEQDVLRVAMAIEGPHLPVPPTCRYTLQELREVRWEYLSPSEQKLRLQEAKAAIEAMCVS